MTYLYPSNMVVVHSYSQITREYLNNASTALRFEVCQNLWTNNGTFTCIDVFIEPVLFIFSGLKNKATGTTTWTNRCCGGALPFCWKTHGSQMFTVTTHEILGNKMYIMALSQGYLSYPVSGLCQQYFHIFSLPRPATALPSCTIRHIPTWRRGELHGFRLRMGRTAI